MRARQAGRPPTPRRGPSDPWQPLRPRGAGPGGPAWRVPGLGPDRPSCPPRSAVGWCAQAWRAASPARAPSCSGRSPAPTRTARAACPPTGAPWQHLRRTGRRRRQARARRGAGRRRAARLRQLRGRVRVRGRLGPRLQPRRRLRLALRGPGRAAAGRPHVRAAACGAACGCARWRAGRAVGERRRPRVCGRALRLPRGRARHIRVLPARAPPDLRGQAKAFRSQLLALRRPVTGGAGGSGRGRRGRGCGCRCGRPCWRRRGACVGLRGAGARRDGQHRGALAGCVLHRLAVRAAQDAGRVASQHAPVPTLAAPSSVRLQVSQAAPQRSCAAQRHRAPIRAPPVQIAHRASRPVPTRCGLRGRVALTLVAACCPGGRSRQLARAPACTASPARGT